MSGVLTASQAAEHLPSKKRRLLFLGQTLPFPPDGGVHIRMYNVLRLLARDFDITALCFYRREERPSAADVAASLAGLRSVARVEAFRVPQEWSGARFAWDHLRSVATGRPYTWYAYESSSFGDRLAELLATESFDLVQIDSLDLAAYLPRLNRVPVVCTHHNVESTLMRRRSHIERSHVRSAYIAYQAELLERLERDWCGRVALNATVSRDDLMSLRALAPSARFACIPNGVDVNEFRPLSGCDSGIISVGGVNWFPNRDALEYLSADILPLIRKRIADVAVRWVGRAADSERQRYRAEHGVELTGYVPDVRPLVRDAACFVVPLRVGGGTRLKILDAWAMGKAVVSTSVGCEGLDARDGENILIRDTPESFADAVVEVVGDRERRAALGAAARATVERTYSWNVVGEGMLAHYLSVLPGAQARA